MPLKLRLTILLCCIIGVTYAQSDTVGNNSSPNEQPYTKTKWGSKVRRSNIFSIEVPPFSYIDAESSPTYQIATEIKLYHVVSLCLEGGGYFGLNGHDWLTNQFSSGRLTEVKGYIFKVEGKLYDVLKNITSGPYFSIEAVDKKQSFNWQDTIHLSPPYLTTFRVFKSIYCFNIKFGQCDIYKSGIIIDKYIGFGVRVRDVSTSLTPQQANALQANDDSNYDSGITEHEVKPAKNVYPNLVLGVKIGYCIK